MGANDKFSHFLKPSLSCMCCYYYKTKHNLDGKDKRKPSSLITSFLYSHQAQTSFTSANI